MVQIPDVENLLEPQIWSFGQFDGKHKSMPTEHRQRVASSGQKSVSESHWFPVRKSYEISKLSSKIECVHNDYLNLNFMSTFHFVT